MPRGRWSSNKRACTDKISYFKLNYFSCPADTCSRFRQCFLELTTTNHEVQSFSRAHLEPIVFFFFLPRKPICFSSGALVGLGLSADHTKMGPVSARHGSGRSALGGEGPRGAQLCAAGDLRGLCTSAQGVPRPTLPFSWREG